MKLASVVVVIICSTAFGSSTGERYLDEGDKVHKDTKFDYLLLANQWPQTFCMLYKATAHSKTTKCRIPQIVDGWGIHGLWPTMNNKQTPKFCNKSWPFDLNKIKDLVPRLNMSWPNLLTGPFPFYRFWDYEWSKHGTCAVSLPAFRGEHNYFGGTLNLKNRFNIDRILRDAGIVPSPTAKYALNKLRQALKTATGASPTFSCFRNKKKQYLGEIRMCLDKNLQVFDCPGKSQLLIGQSFKSCLPNTSIEIPPIANQG